LALLTLPVKTVLFGAVACPSGPLAETECLRRESRSSQSCRRDGSVQEITSVHALSP
jgi:hypothetical protein